MDDIAAHPPSITAEQAQQFRKEAENSIDTKLWRYCPERFPVDFAAQKWCVDDQFDGLRQVVEFTERYNTTPDTGKVVLSEPAQTIALFCYDRYPDNYRMRAWCQEHQAQAARSLGKM